MMAEERRTIAQRKGPSSGSARTAALIALLATAATACGDAGHQSERGVAQAAGDAAAAEPALALGPIETTPRDSVIFRETMEWAHDERLDTLDIGPMVAAIGQRFVGAPYEPGTLDPPGPERLIINLRTFDCVTFVESMVAMARALRAGDPSFDAFARELRRIRYRDGLSQEYPERLHYFSDWIAANDARGIVRALTDSLGGEPDPEPIDFMSTHVDAYRQLADTANLRAIREIEREISARGRVYIPEDRIAAVASEIRDGDVIAATSTVEGLDIAHTGIALWRNGALHLMHAPLVGKEVEISELPLAARIQRIDGQDGIMVARPR
ncbi:MAG: N-acetylmuramoyl-L-alanine amidase-like domain-containing protein [Longimicrobiales bacterium]